MIYTNHQNIDATRKIPWWGKNILREVRGGKLMFERQSLLNII